MTAQIDGQSFTAAQNGMLVTSSQNTPGFLSITGTQFSGTDYVALSLYLGFITTTGTYPLGVNQGTTPGGGGSVLIKNGATLNIYAIDFTGDRGSVDITTLTSTRIAGTFSFVAPPQLGSAAPGVKTVTNGSFDVALPATFAPSSGDNTGNIFTATVNGQGWTGATVVGVGDLSTGAFSLGGSTTDNTVAQSTVSINLVTSTPVSAGNTYDQTGVKVQYDGQANNCCWGGAGATSSVTITSLTATRVAGTFTANLPAVGGSASGPLVITNGVFDLRIP
ncbi:MAG TPA: hypothetical protein VH438_08395 [Gemmatimonadales bacterium]|jgi:hypothetical protein